ncbi:hypothetical protein CJ305_07820 [Leeuwenhoekiella nanhaiensis]|uniref:Uncharacterized protein n=1 Tax=Leeuwenhoekiella nanhaiensis TaxID=1655491 RepID=A0A2G1VSW1_9FLAO|nr:hypothetical protein CJ305_07820 [Leeuwenhoekiella nanhaiensis]
MHQGKRKESLFVTDIIKVLIDRDSKVMSLLKSVSFLGDANRGTRFTSSRIIQMTRAKKEKKILQTINIYGKLKPQGTRYNRAQTEGFAAVKLLGK